MARIGTKIVSIDHNRQQEASGGEVAKHDPRVFPRFCRPDSISGIVHGFDSRYIANT